MITWENYEEFMMMYADGELNVVETQELMAFVNQNPQLKSELADLEMVRLVPDTAVVYANKEKLLKPEPAKVIAFPVWKRYSIAAGVAAILLLSTYRFMNGDNINGDDDSAIAVNKTTIPVKNVVPVTPDTAAIAHAGIKTVSDPVKVAPVVKQHAEQQAVAQVTKKQPNAARQITPVLVAPSLKNDATDLAQLPVAGAKQLPAEPAKPAKMITEDVPQYAAATPTEEKKTFWDKLPVDEIKKKQLGNMANAIKETTDGKTLSIKIEKRKLVLSF